MYKKKTLSKDQVKMLVYRPVLKKRGIQSLTDISRKKKEHKKPPLGTI